MIRKGFLLAGICGGIWTLVSGLSVAIILAYLTGAAISPSILQYGVVGILLGFVLIRFAQYRFAVIGGLAIAVLVLTGFQPFGLPLLSAPYGQIPAFLIMLLLIYLPLNYMLSDISTFAGVDRFQFEEACIRFFSAIGYVFFLFIVLVPFYVMVMTSFKSQQALLANPLDLSIEWHKGWDIFQSYVELFTTYNFGSYLLLSFIISVLTVIMTLAFSIPGAYAVARLRFRGRAALSRSILLIYMVPMIVLALPLYVGFSALGLRNTITGILIIYPITTIPVALYMLQGYFRGLPAEIEEAGLMDGLSRFAVIRKITLPLSLPAIASVSLYVFMIAWNEFLLAFMLLDDPEKFTLTRGIAMLNSSEIPRQHLMAGSVIATIPIMALFLGLEKFMTKGLTAGSVKG